ncbi:hypothetical protein GGU11DRAFT_336251 [Lentinula aff. detonsa]|nr:hypothetical protein GGU11DRAFT_336251 [Lentinula aff. detonsa]
MSLNLKLKLPHLIRFGHPLSWRDMMLILIGASFMHLVAVFYPISPGGLGLETAVIQINTHVHSGTVAEELEMGVAHHHDQSEAEAQRIPSDLDASTFPVTSIIHHAPGYTLFRNLYMSNGTLYILTDHSTKFPEIRKMTSISMFADGSSENIAAREPTKEIMDFIDVVDAKRRWEDRVFKVEGNTILFNDPSQFLRHYYHFVAELWFGVQAFWHGAFSEQIQDTIPVSAKAHNWNWNAYPILSNSNHPSMYQKGDNKGIPAIDRSIFMHTTPDGWRDNPGFNSFFLRAAFPSMSVEHEQDWQDRVAATNTISDKGRAFLFPLTLLVDRSAAFRDDMTGSHTQRTAAQAWEYMRNQGRLRGEKVGGWWHPVRNAVLSFAGLEQNVKSEPEGTLPLPTKILITYISRQSGSRRKLTKESHQSLVQALEDLVYRRNSVHKDKLEFELIVMEAEKLTKDEQLSIISRTTILLGPHGNGLTHLLFMSPTSLSTVIEIFYPGGFAHDYHWTSRALGMGWVGVWNDTSFTYPNEPEVAYPEGFQEDYIPVHGPEVVRVIEDIVDKHAEVMDKH